MCGLFGAICVSGTHTGHVLAVVRQLGKHSEERGRDAAGLAITTPNVDPTGEASEGGYTTPTPEHTSTTHSIIDGIASYRTVGAFTGLSLPTAARALTGSVLLGHTRAASQGDIDNLANTSPLHVGAITGTHNGDVSTKSVPLSEKNRKLIHGQTDSEVVFAALHAAGKDRRKITHTFRRIRGRGAYVYLDRRTPDRLYLVRTAFTPLCFTYDQHGNFYYASNPDWFRRVHAAMPDIEFADPTLLPEGTLLTVDTRTGEPSDVRRFTPTCRTKDESIGELTAYRGFTAADKAADKTLHRHKVNQKLPDWPTARTVPLVAGAATATSASSPVTSTLEGEWEETQSLLEQRLAAEVPDEYPDTHDYTPAGDTTLADQLWDSIEEACWQNGEFDENRFEELISLPINEARALLHN